MAAVYRPLDPSLIKIMTPAQRERIDELLVSGKISSKIVHQHNIAALCSNIFRNFLEQHQNLPKISDEIFVNNCIRQQWTARAIQNKPALDDAELLESENYYRFLMPPFIKQIVKANPADFLDKDVENRVAMLTRAATLFKIFIDAMQSISLTAVYKEDVHNLLGTLIRSSNLTRFRAYVVDNFDEGVSEESIIRDFKPIFNAVLERGPMPHPKPSVTSAVTDADEKD